MAAEITSNSEDHDFKGERGVVGRRTLSATSCFHGNAASAVDVDRRSRDSHVWRFPTAWLCRGPPRTPCAELSGV